MSENLSELEQSGFIDRETQEKQLLWMEVLAV